MTTPTPQTAAAAFVPCGVIELRQYTLHPGCRDELITLFEREFTHTQEALGLHVLGIFRDADNANRFVWLRGFADMATRRRAMEAFYDGPVWQQHRSAANATMIDSDDVLLLRPLAGSVAAIAAGTWHVMAWPLAGPLQEAQRAAIAQQPGAWFESETAPNNFSRLPVRAGHWFMALSPQAAALPAALERAFCGTPIRLRLQPTHRSPLQ